jgi:DNA-binding Xre family transcriptional regulator
MRHLGQTLKEHIESNHITKTDVASKVGIAPTYLSTIFNKASIDCELWEKLCNACNLSPMEAFTDSYNPVTCKNYSASAEKIKALEMLLDEKERTIRILMRQLDIKTATPAEHS